MLHSTHTFVLGLFGTEIGWSELLIVAIIGVIVFGKRLPEVGRSVGKSIVEFKKGLKGIEEELHSASDESSNQDSANTLTKSAPPSALEANMTSVETADSSSEKQASPAGANSNEDANQVKHSASL